MAPDSSARNADTEAQGRSTNVRKEPNYLELVQEATDSEHQMSLLQALQLYPKAAGWSVALSACLIMEGYDKSLLGSLYGFPAFKRQFGIEMPDGSYQVTAPWQAGLSNGAQVGSIIGLLGSGILAERFGYRVVIMGSLVAMIGFIFLMFFAVNIQMLEAAYILVGIPWGVFQTITTTYAAEVCPMVLRPYLTTFVNLCWVMGQFIAAGVLRAFVGDAGQWAWRIPYAIQWAYPVPILVAVYLAPESPWWLVRKGRLDDAEKSLERLSSRKRQGEDRFDPRKTVAMMVHTNEIEEAQVAGTSYRDCFRGVNLRRTEITCVVWAAQALCGNVFMIYSSYFYQLAGLPPKHAFSMNLGQSGMAFVGTLLSWVCIVYFGRRTLYTVGLFALFAILLIIGIVSVTPGSAGASWGTASLVLVYTFTYDLFIGPICYSLVAEMPSTRLRPKTVVLARTTFNICGIIDAVLMPYMINPTAWNWGGKAGFFWAGTCVMCAVYMYFRLPEPRGKTYGELDVLFEQKVGARKFGKAKVNAVSGSVEIIE